MEETDQIKAIDHVDVHRNSWWKTPDGERVVVVIRIFHRLQGNSWAPSSYDLLEMTEQEEKHVDVDTFRNLVRAGKLVRVVRKKDIPRPPSLF